MEATNSRVWTYAGLAIALLGLPAIVIAYHAIVTVPTTATVVARETLILALTGFLLWIIVRREKLPLWSIGLRSDRLANSLAWGIGLTIVIIFAVLAMLALYGALGIRYGEGAPIATSVWATLLTVLRAGISEEIFYRGFALERLQSLTGSKWIAAAVTLAVFAGFHYRQGLPGIMLALVLGALMTGFYLWKRNLVAAIFAHFLVDFIPNVLLPLIGGES